jgi:hypothetical protein
MVRRFPKLVVVNVGTLHRMHDPCCAIIDFQLGGVTFFDLDDRGSVVTEGTTLPFATPA